MYRKSCTRQLCTCMLVLLLMACMNSVYMFLHENSYMQHIHVRLFSLSIKDYSSKAGVAVFPSVVLDTITTWNAEAFAINRESQLGISLVTQLTVRKDLFVSLELPFSINFQETVTVTPLVFYFGTNNSVTVSSHTCTCIYIYMYK